MTLGIGALSWVHEIVSANGCWIFIVNFYLEIFWIFQHNILLPQPLATSMALRRLLLEPRIRPQRHLIPRSQLQGILDHTLALRSLKNGRILTPHTVLLQRLHLLLKRLTQLVSAAEQVLLPVQLRALL